MLCVQNAIEHLSNLISREKTVANAEDIYLLTEAIKNLSEILVQTKDIPESGWKLVCLQLPMLIEKVEVLCPGGEIVTAKLVEEGNGSRHKWNVITGEKQVCPIAWRQLSKV